MTNKQIIIDGKIIGCPCYIDRPLHRYHKGCLVQSQAFKEQQTEEKPILRCDEIKNCPIKENFKQLQCKTAECEELKERIKCNCFDPKSNNNRCISYNRIAEDYERDLKRLENKIAECEKYEGAFRRIKKQSKINCEEICGKSYEACDDKDCLAIQIRDIINKAKDGD